MDILQGAKPCPFCGCAIIEILPQGFFGDGNEWLIKCTACGVKKFVYTKYRKQLLTEWNTRRET